MLDQSLLSPLGCLPVDRPAAGEDTPRQHPLYQFDLVFFPDGCMPRQSSPDALQVLHDDRRAHQLG
jgi:hypothetical protein